MSLADGGLAVLSVTMAAVTTVGLAVGARRSHLPDGRASEVSAGAAAAMAAWLALTAALAGAGLLSRFDTAPPRVAFLPLAVLAIMAILSRTRTFAKLGLLANIVVIALRSAPGPLNAGWVGVPSSAIAGVPFVWLPSFLVPLAVLGHVTSLRQLRAPGPVEPAAPRGGRG